MHGSRYAGLYIYIYQILLQICSFTDNIDMQLDFPDEHLQKNIQHLIDEIVSQRGTLPTGMYYKRSY